MSEFVGYEAQMIKIDLSDTNEKHKMASCVDLAEKADQEIATLRAKISNTNQAFRDAVSEINGYMTRAETAEAKVRELESIRREQAIDLETILKSHTEEQDRADKAEAEVLQLRDAIKEVPEALENYISILESQGWTRHKAREISDTKLILVYVQDALANGTGQGEN